MTYSSGGLIQATDYNGFASTGASNVNDIYGTGSLDKGYGQTAVATVSAGATVTAAQWTSLFSTITTIANHQGTSITALTNPSAGQTISYVSAVSGDVSAIYALPARNNAAAVGTTITASGVATRSTGWSTSLTATHTITFASANAARYFFNAGGRITWAGARSGGAVNVQNTAWTDLFTACGTLNWTTGTSTQSIAGTSYTGTTKTGGSGTPTTLLTGVGFYDLTTLDQEVFKQYSSTYVYTGNYVSINIKANAAAGSATVITLTVLMVDANTKPGDVVDGTLTSTITAVAPSTTYLSNTWGTPTLASSISGS